MGCEVTCPLIPGAKVVSWQIPDPIGKDVEEYRKRLAKEQLQHFDDGSCCH